MAAWEAISWYKRGIQLCALVAEECYRAIVWGAEMIHDRDFDEYVPRSRHVDYVVIGESSSISPNELDISAFRYSIVNALVS
jgi:hypothetical protein